MSAMIYTLGAIGMAIALGESKEKSSIWWRIFLILAWPTFLVHSYVSQSIKDSKNA